MYDILIKRKETLPWRTIVGMARDAAAGVHMMLLKKHLLLLFSMQGIQWIPKLIISPPGVIHLHCEHVIHRDLATRNCLVS